MFKKKLCSAANARLGAKATGLVDGTWTAAWMLARLV